MVDEHEDGSGMTDEEKEQIYRDEKEEEEKQELEEEERRIREAEDEAKREGWIWNPEEEDYTDNKGHRRNKYGERE